VDKTELPSLGRIKKEGRLTRAERKEGRKEKKGSARSARDRREEEPPKRGVVHKETAGGKRGLVTWIL